MFAHTLAADHRDINELQRAALAALESGSRTAALIRVDLFWARLAMHIRAEHLHLFPAIAGTASTDAAIERLREDHNYFMNRLATAMKALRASEGDAEPDLATGIAILRELGPRLDEHNRFEEETVYQHKTNNLSEAERAELTRSIEKEISNLPPRFS
jgi:hypothetical protein